MRYSSVTLAVTPIFFATASVAGWGSATVKNSCGDDAFLWSCGDTPGEKIPIPASQSHTEKYYTKGGGGGISLKIATRYPSGPKAGQSPDSIFDQPQPNITQFEYTVGSPGPPANALFYDLSNINGYPFVRGGLHVTSSDGSVDVTCPKGVQKCSKAYNGPTDDWATGSCGEAVDLVLELCSEAPGVEAAGGAPSSGDGGNVDTNSANTAGVNTPSQPSEAPQVTPPPEPVQVNNKLAKPDDDEDVVVWVTQQEVVTEIAHAKPKRDDIHLHQHGHQKIHKKRHNNNF